MTSWRIGSLPITMKTPRVADFDPDAKVPVLKSPLEGMPAIGKPPQKQPPATPPPVPEDKPEAPATQTTPERVNARTPVRPNGKRIITRNSFEIYEDQMDALRKLSLQDKMEGKLGSMSQMVREAIDAYLNEKTSSK
jgi:hypothetical protein